MTLLVQLAKDVGGMITAVAKPRCRLKFAKQAGAYHLMTGICHFMTGESAPHRSG
jgi:hypothetical protein